MTQRPVQRVRIVADAMGDGGRVFLDGRDISSITTDVIVRMSAGRINEVTISVLPDAIELDGGFVVTAKGARPHAKSLTGARPA